MADDRKPGHLRITSLMIDTLQKRLGSSHSSNSSQSSAGRRSSISHLPPSFLLNRDVEQEPLVSTIPHEGFARDEDWACVQKAMISIFQGIEITPYEKSLLCKKVKKLADTELGSSIYDYYKNQLMPKCMQRLRNAVLYNGEGHLKGLQAVWDNFYQNILSEVTILMLPVQTKEHSFKQLNLLGFRDLVLLRTDIETILGEKTEIEISPAIQQMLLVLQSVWISNSPSDNYIRLERLVGRVVVPYLGYLGLYEGTSEPKVHSQNYINTVIMKPKHSTDDFLRAPTFYQKKRLRQPLFSNVLQLDTVKEMTPQVKSQIARHLMKQDGPSASPPVSVRRTSAGRDVRGRRYSCDILMQ